MATAVGNTDKVVTRGLKIAYDFADNDCFTSGSGNTTLNSLVGSNSTATSTSGVNIVHKATNGGIMEVTSPGSSAAQQGNAGQIRIPQSLAQSAIGGATELTIECWIRPDVIFGPTPDRNSIIVCWPIADSTATSPYTVIALVLLYDTSKLRCEVGDGSSKITIDNLSPALSMGSWYQVGYKWDGSNTTCFVNGSLHGSSGSASYGSLGSPSAKIYLGSYNSYNYYHYDGGYGIFRAYDKALTSAEILQNYNANKSRFGL